MGLVTHISAADAAVGKQPHNRRHLTVALVLMRVRSYQVMSNLGIFVDEMLMVLREATRILLPGCDETILEERYLMRVVRCFKICRLKTTPINNHVRRSALDETFATKNDDFFT